jgi:isoquinoline 1-oxidoreductase alpha subunit
MATLNINGQVRDVAVEPETPLLWVIREQVGLTGTKYGCGIAQCGACSGHINGEVVRSCSIRVGDVASDDRHHRGPRPPAYTRCRWPGRSTPQCGYCQSARSCGGSAAQENRQPIIHRRGDDQYLSLRHHQRIREAVHMAAGTTVGSKSDNGGLP